MMSITGFVRCEFWRARVVVCCGVMMGCVASGLLCSCTQPDGSQPAATSAPAEDHGSNFSDKTFPAGYAYKGILLVAVSATQHKPAGYLLFRGTNRRQSLEGVLRTGIHATTLEELVPHIAALPHGAKVYPGGPRMVHNPGGFVHRLSDSDVVRLRAMLADARIDGPLSE